MFTKINQIEEEKEYLFSSCQQAKNQSKFQNAAFLLVDIQIWINIFYADMTRGATYF